jgi:hypothetical protein
VSNPASSWMAARIRLERVRKCTRPTVPWISSGSSNSVAPLSCRPKIGRGANPARVYIPQRATVAQLLVDIEHVVDIGVASAEEHTDSLASQLQFPLPDGGEAETAMAYFGVNVGAPRRGGAAKLKQLHMSSDLSLGNASKPPREGRPKLRRQNFTRLMCE